MAHHPRRLLANPCDANNEDKINFGFIITSFGKKITWQKQSSVSITLKVRLTQARDWTAPENRRRIL